MSAQYVYVPESDRESRLLAEIERLKEENSALANSLVEQDFEIDRLKAQLRIDEDLWKRLECKDKLIGELADALQFERDLADCARASRGD